MNTTTVMDSTEHQEDTKLGTSESKDFIVSKLTERNIQIFTYVFIAASIITSLVILICLSSAWPGPPSPPLCTNKCMNGGTCHKTVCMCAEGWTGKNCEQDIDECAANSTLCVNGGRCLNDQGSFSCFCPPAYTDTNCGTEMDLCRQYSSASVCLSGSLCLTSSTSKSYECQCRSGFSGSDCSAISMAAFSASLNQAASVPGKVSFNVAAVNMASMFSEAVGVVTVPTNSTYYFFYTFALPPGSSALFTPSFLSPIQNVSVLSRNNSLVNGSYDTLSGDDLRLLDAHQSAYILMSYNVYGCTTNSPTVWLGFRVNDVALPLVAFGANGAQPTYDATLNTFKLLFYNVWLDTAAAWNTTNVAYTIPVAGLYVVSVVLSVAQPSYACAVRINAVIAQGNKLEGQGAGSWDTTSRMMVISGDVGDVMQVTCNTSLHNGYMADTSFKGFLYRPSYHVNTGSQAPIWSVFMLPNSQYKSFYIDSQAISSQGVFVSTAHVTMLVAGVYYVDLYVGRQTVQLNVSLTDYTNTLAAVTLPTTAVAGRAANIVQLTHGSTLTLNSTVYSSTSAVYIFTGFLLYPWI